MQNVNQLGESLTRRWTTAKSWLLSQDRKDLRKRAKQVAFYSSLACGLLLLGGLVAFYVVERDYDDFVAERLRDGAFDPYSRVYSGGTYLTPRSELTGEQLEHLLRRAGYAHDEQLRPASFAATADTITWRPRDAEKPFEAKLDDDGIAHLQGKKMVAEVTSSLLTTLPDNERTKRRLVTYDQVPDVLRNAILSIEDRNFFHHNGVDWQRTANATVRAALNGDLPRGVSTLTQQLARGFFLTRERTLVRKFEEFLIARALERRMSKEKIFESYVNQVYLGRTGPYNIAGMAEASFAYFGKPISELRPEEAAVLAGLLKAPSALDPRSHPDRCRERRDLVLRAMASEGHLTDAELRAALDAPIELIEPNTDAETAPYYVDLVRDEAAELLGEERLYGSSWEIRTALDPQLQAAATEAIRQGIAEVEKRLEKAGRESDSGDPPQAAIVALDPKTGAVLALVGGREYSSTQLNRALARRQPGSTFKPFVYAAALETGLRQGQKEVITPATLIYDSEVTIEFGDDEYEPSNYGGSTNGFVTVRDALVKSLNVPTVLLAKKVGYGRIARIARAAGLPDVGATPSAALGSYEANLLELAGAYTVFANEGTRVEPYLITSIKAPSGETEYLHRPKTEKVLDSRVAHVTRSLMEDVVNRGTAAGIRARGFRAHAAGKTGTDDDGWFVGFTSELLCAVWVGYDDNSDLGLEGSKSALPIWTAFMKEAEKLEPYRKSGAFDAPQGVVDAEVNLARLYPHFPEVEGSVEAAFIEGTVPKAKKKSFWGAPLRMFSRKQQPATTVSLRD